MLTTLFVDLNSYFASVEQQSRPELRGKPVAVVPVEAETTCAIAASYEAKRFGVRTGTRVRDARLMCPGLVLVKARPRLYVEFHHAILDAANTVLPVHQVHSIDEFSCKLMGDEKRPERALGLARGMKRAIVERVGVCMTASVGVGPSRFIAKAASDMQKPDGLVMIERHELPRRLFSMKPIDLAGIGPRMSERLRRRGVETVEQLCEKSEREMIDLWGSVVGAWWHAWLRGEDLDHAGSTRRTIGHSHVLPPELRSEEGARAVLVRLVHKAAARARALGYVARRLSVSVRGMTPREAQRPQASLFAAPAPSPKWKAEATFPEASDTLSLVQRLAELWAARGQGHPRPLKVSVTLSDLSPASLANLSLFEDSRRRDALSGAIDKLNAKFGKNTVYLASMHRAQDAAPTRIAFGHIPDITLPDADEVEDEP